MFDDDHLTAEQRRAATHDGGHLLVVAGAGTGKTTTLTARLAHLVASGVAPERILLLTFSRRSAAELLGRAEQLAGRRVTAACWGGTFHAVAHRLLRRHGRALGLEPGFTVLDSADGADLFALVRDETAGGEPVARRRPRKETLADIWSRCVNARTPLSQVLRRSFPWCVEDEAEIRATVEGYIDRKRRSAVVDYDDLLLGWDALLAVPQVASLLQGQFEHILVDEYQDTNALQADVLEGMCRGGTVLTAVGDDAQAIYSFRAATVRNILDFGPRFGADVLTLEQNHRSTPPLLAASNAVIAEAAERHPKELWSGRTGAARPSLVRCADEGDQSSAVCTRILDHLERGTPLRRQAVLVRTGHHSDGLELELTARRIPFVKYGGLRFLEAAHVKDLVCVLRLVENPRDELAWFRVLQLVEGVGPATARRAVADLCGDEGPVSRLAGGAGGALPPAALPDAADLAVALGEAHRLAPDRPGPAVERARAWLDPRVERRYGGAEARLADRDQLTLVAGAAASLARFLVDLTLDPPAATGDFAGPPSRDEDVLTVSTIHSAKGAEWDVVHLIHLADGNVPSDMATGDAEAIEEERRLLYVAMTRARDHLYAYAPLRWHHRPRGRDDAHGYGQLTRFFTPAVLARLDHDRPPPPPPGDGPMADHRPLATVDTRTRSLLE